MTQEQADRVVEAFRDQFGGEVEAIAGDQPGHFQFSVSSPEFKEMTNLQRQDQIWDIVERVLSREDALDVSMVWTFAPGEMEEWLEGLSS